MPEFHTDAIHEALSERLGSSLRGVICYDGDAYDDRMRDDVAALYSEAEVRAFVDDTIIDQLGESDEQGLFYLGELEASIRLFEESWVIRVSAGYGTKRGCLFSVEREGVTLSSLEECLKLVQTQTGN